MEDLRLFMVMLGCKPEGRLTEQHDIFFGIGKSLSDVVPQMNAFWSGVKGGLHIDAWREISVVGDYSVKIIARSDQPFEQASKLFFINLGGYKPGEFEEYHYKMVIVAESVAAATKISKASAFYKHCGFKGATSHIDDKYGIDIDDIYKIEEILSKDLTDKYQIQLVANTLMPEDELHIGYVKFSKLLSVN